MQKGGGFDALRDIKESSCGFTVTVMRMHGRLLPSLQSPYARVLIERVSSTFYSLRSSVQIHNELGVAVEVRLKHPARRGAHVYVLWPKIKSNQDLESSNDQMPSHYNFTIGEIMSNAEVFCRPLVDGILERHLCRFCFGTVLLGPMSVGWPLSNVQTFCYCCIPQFRQAARNTRWEDPVKARHGRVCRLLRSFGFG